MFSNNKWKHIQFWILLAANQQQWANYIGKSILILSSMNAVVSFASSIKATIRQNKVYILIMLIEKLHETFLGLIKNDKHLMRLVGRHVACVLN